MRETLEPYLRRFGRNSSSYSTMQGGLEYLVLEGTGYVAYSLSNSHSPIAFALSDPLCDKRDYGLIVDEFMRMYENVAFVQVSHEFGKVLNDMGFYVNQMGIETEIDIQRYEYSGRLKEDLRRNIVQLEKEGIIAEEVNDIKNVSARLQEISSEWIGSKIVDNKEIWFIARKAIYDNEKDVRKFVARRGDKLYGFVVFDPIYDSEKVQGYCASILRTSSDAHPATTRLVVKKAIEKFRDEEIKTLSLGISPFYGIDDGMFRYSKFMSSFFKWSYRSDAMNRIYPFKNLTFTKSRYGGGISDGRYRDDNVKMKKVYFAHTKRFPVRLLYEIYTLTGIIDGVFSTIKKLFAY